MAEWPMWRLVLEHAAKLEEIDGQRATYSLADVYKANSLLDMKADIESAALRDEAKERNK